MSEVCPFCLNVNIKENFWHPKYCPRCGAYQTIGGWKKDDETKLRTQEEIENIEKNQLEGRKKVLNFNHKKFGACFIMTCLGASLILSLSTYSGFGLFVAVFFLILLFSTHGN